MNKREAAEYLGVSTRAIERYTARGKLTPEYEKGRTGPAPVYDRTQLDALRREMNDTTGKLRLTIDTDKPAKIDRTDSHISFNRAGSNLGALVAAINKVHSQSASEIAAKLLFSIKEAQKLTGLSEEHIRNAIHTGKLKGSIIGRGYKVKKADLEKYVARL